MMPMRFILPLLLICSFAHAADEYQRIVCIDDPSLTVTLLVKPIASPADEDFIGWELNNHTDRTLKIYNARFRLDHVAKTDRATGKPISQGYMMSGNPYDLLWRDGQPVPVRREDSIPPGISRHMRYCSLRGLATTGFPREGAWTLAGRAEFQISLDAKTHFSSPNAGVPFQFDLVAPDQKAIAAMSEQLKRLLAKPVEPFGDAAAFQTLLSIDEVASTVDIKTLLNAFAAADHSPRRPLREYIDRKYPTNDVTIAFWIDAIQHGHHTLLQEMADAKNVRSPKLLEPLVECIAQREDSSRYFALRILYQQRTVMPDRLAVATRISPVVLKQVPWIERGDTDFKNHIIWQEEFENLALTGDPAMAKYFLPYLDRKDVVIRAREIALANNGVDTRACDAAYNSLLVLLDRPEKPFTMGFGDARIDAAKEHARRDELIAKLKAELTAK